MTNRQIMILVAAVLAAALAVPTLGRDNASEPNKTSNNPSAGSADSRRQRIHNARVGPRIFAEDRFTEDKVKDVMAFAKKHFPEEYERLVALRKENPRQFRRAIRRMWWLYRRVRHLPEDIQAAAVAKHRLNVAIFHTRRELLQSEDSAEKAKLTKKLSSLLEEQFDNDQIVKEYMIKRIEQQLADLKAEVEQRKKDRKKIILKRLERLLRPGPPALRATDTPRTTRPGPRLRRPDASVRQRNVEKDK